jgi:hypothetical protein
MPAAAVLTAPVLGHRRRTARSDADLAPALSPAVEPSTENRYQLIVLPADSTR